MSKEDKQVGESVGERVCKNDPFWLSLALFVGFLVGGYVKTSHPPDTVEAVVMEGEPGTWAKCRLDGTVYYRQEDSAGCRRWRWEDGTSIPWNGFSWTRGVALERDYQEAVRAINDLRIKKKISGIAAEEKN